MGQRFVQLDSSYTGNEDGSAVLSVAQLPPNPAILAPGPALLFVVVNGVPSVGQHIMVGSGKIENQAVGETPILPQSSLPAGQSTTANNPESSSPTTTTPSSSGLSIDRSIPRAGLLAGIATLMVALI